MRSTTLLIGCIFVFVKVQGQNLVLNPSFEEPVSCPPPTADWSGFGTIHYAKHWFSPSKSSDYFTPCYNNPFTYWHGTPTNSLGHQEAHDGEAYAGIFAIDYSPNHPTLNHVSYREYLEGTLASPLLNDSVYTVKFYVVATESINNNTVVTDRIGAYLHKDFFEPTQLPIGVSSVIDVKPQIENPHGRMLSDTANWTLICGYYKATGEEAFITIGNFYTNENTSFISISPYSINSVEAYYFIDDVSVEKSPINPYQWIQGKTICTPDSTSQYSLPPSLTDVLWSTGDTAHTVSVQGPGTYWVRAALDGCYFTDTFHIEHTPAPAFGFADDTLTVCNSTLPLNLETTDCCAGVLWSTGDTTKSTKIEQEGLVWVSQQNLCGILSDSFWLQVVYPLSIDLGADTALCDTAQFARVLEVPQGQPNYRWSTGETASAVTVTQPGTYWLEVRNECGVFTDTIVFKDLRQVRLAASRDTTLCLTEPVHLFATPGFDTYLWNTGENTNEAMAGDYGLYTVSATNDCGTQTDTVLVTESNYPEIQLPTEVEISLGDSIQLNPFVAHDKPLVFQWSPATGLDCSSCESPLAFPWKTTDFLLIAEDGLRCREEAVVRVSVVDRRRIYVPNVFKPTGDGPNALLTLSFGSEVDEVVSAAIYDRWGGLVVSRRGLAASAETVIWDGKWRGKDAQPGVYALVLTVRLKNGEIVRVAKDVTLVR